MYYLFIGGTINSAKITFDPNKREATLRDRDLDFLDADRVFSGPHINVPDTRFDYEEQRYQAVGYLNSRMVMLVWTPRSDARHVI